MNYVSLLGWSHPEEKEVLSKEELAASMSLDRVGRSDCQLDPDKFRWVSQQHLAQQSLEDLVLDVRPFIDRERFPDTGDNFSAVIDTLEPAFRLIPISMNISGSSSLKKTQC
ncbi:MAG: hypothetical protein CM1200mP14_18860 [Gammaproteobacteria bacterium]|nr:MAG: hypothetical protein CM1200mP14_18860 [Gammaproteobacteria bacterium]